MRLRLEQVRRSGRTAYRYALVVFALTLGPANANAAKGQWVATGFVAGTVLAPRATSLAATTFAAVAVSDALQFGYAALERRAH